MPGLQQESTSQYAVPNGQTDVQSPQYQQQLVSNYAASSNPAYQQSQRDLRSNMAARGMDNGGLAASEQAGLAQSRAADVGKYAANVGNQQAQQGFEQQRAATAQQYALQQESARAADQMKMMQSQQQYGTQQAQNGMWGQALGGAGSIIGSMYGGPMGGMAAQKLLGQGVPPAMTNNSYYGGDGSSELPLLPPDYAG